MKRKDKIVWGIAILLTLLFIFTRSMKSVSESSNESMLFSQWIQPFLELFLGKGNVTVHIVRKLAHFTEFGILGVELGAFFRKCSVWPFWLSLIFALTDETIQIFYDRGSQVADVWLDYSGALCGIGVAMLFLYLIHSKRK